MTDEKLRHEDNKWIIESVEQGVWYVRRIVNGQINTLRCTFDEEVDALEAALEMAKTRGQ